MKALLNKFVFMILIVTTTQCSSQTAQNFENVNAAEFKILLTEENTYIVDVRSQAEYNRGYIEGAELYSLQDQNVKEKLLALPKDAKILLYCYSGSRSAYAASFLLENGYTKVYNLQKGILEWNSMQFPLVIPQNQTTTTVVAENAFTIESFNNEINSAPIVFVDFYAPWCGPCKQMMPAINELTNEYAGKVKIVKINTDESKELTQSLGIKGVPLFALYKDGKVVFQQYGAMEKQVIIQKFNENLE